MDLKEYLKDQLKVAEEERDAARATAAPEATEQLSKEALEKLEQALATASLDFRVNQEKGDAARHDPESLQKLLDLAARCAKARRHSPY